MDEETLLCSSLRPSPGGEGKTGSDAGLFVLWAKATRFVPLPVEEGSGGTGKTSVVAVQSGAIQQEL